MAFLFRDFHYSDFRDASLAVPVGRRGGFLHFCNPLRSPPKAARAERKLPQIQKTQISKFGLGSLFVLVPLDQHLKRPLAVAEGDAGSSRFIGRAR